MRAVSVKNKVKYVALSTARRVASVLIIVLGISLIAFFISYLCPGDPVTLQLEAMGMAPEESLINAVKEERGLNDPFFVQYGKWVKGMITGDLGKSVVTQEDIADEFIRYLPNTLKLTFVALFLATALSLAIGVLCAVYSHSVFDYIVSFVTYLFASFPSFFLALMMLLIFGSVLGWFPIIANDTAGGMVMPVLLLTFTTSSYYIRQIRAIVLEQLSSDYIAGCKARGVPYRTILFRHVLKNSMVPIITMIGISFGGMLGGTSIVESIFSWKGIGLYALKAIQNLDYTVIQTYVAWMAIIYLAVNLLVDVACAAVDPRAKILSDGEI
ncbi:MAG: ABC transporter permease [Syntrophomonadaceae bacterium]|nr:ABC transporter permease [Syntrophomonadaceae bacterium]